MRQLSSRFCGLLLLPCLCSLLPGQPAQCTQDTLVGTYAIATQGTMLVPSSAGSPVAMPSARLAILSFDSQGVMAGAAIGAMGGTVGPVPGAGSIKVNPDCTAIGKTAAGTTSFDVILDEGREIRALMFQGPGVTPMVQGVGRRISRVPNTVAPVQCSAGDVHGVYAFTHQGTYIMSQLGMPQPTSQTALMIGFASVDYEGRLSGAGKISLGGNTLDFTVASGQFDLKADCSAKAHMKIQSGPMTDEGESWIAVLDGGGELWAIQTSSTLAKPIVTGIWKRISSIPWTDRQP